MDRLRYLLVFLVLLLLTACDTGAPATAVPPTMPPTPSEVLPQTTDTPAPDTLPPTTAPLPPTNTAAPPAPTATVAPPSPAAVASSTPMAGLPGPEQTAVADLTNVSHGLGSIFMVPTAPPTPVAQLVPQMGAATGALNPNIAQEVTTYFNNFYQARTLAPGGDFDIEGVRNLTDESYRDYTVALLQKDEDDITAGKLLQVSYSDLAITVDQWQPGANGAGTALITLNRTKHETRKGLAPTSDTATGLRFRLERRPFGSNVAWVAVDFYNPPVGKWISESVPPASKDIAQEITDFFQQFYAARTLVPGGAFDINKTRQITAFAYQAYTIPLLEGQQADANAGKLTSVSYSDLKVEIVSWFPQATSHGGIATVSVSRTSHVVRPSGPEAPQTATYQFRLHRHWDETGKGLWLAVDFLSPITNKWVSESAGLSGPVPPDGHG